MIELTGKEVLQVQYLLPVQGSLKILESAQNILDKIQKFEIQEVNLIDFSDEEINFLIGMINILDEAGKLNIASLSLIKKILKLRS